MNHASCLCGGVKLSFEYVADSVSHCHCSMCRKFHGAAFATYGSVERDKLNIESGQDLVTSYDATEVSRRSFCRICGSSLFFEHDATPDAVDIPLGLLDDEPEIRPIKHIFYRDRPQWSSAYDDDLPKFDTYE